MTLSLAIHGALLILVGSLHGLLQERLLKSSYGSDAQQLNSTSLLVFFNGTCAILVALSILLWRIRGAGLLRSLRPASPLSHFALVGAYRFFATSCQYQALSHVSFTTVTLVKTIKLVPVVLAAYFLHSKASKSSEWVGVVMVAVGCATYLGASSGGPSALDDDEVFLDTVLGGILLAGYLFFDCLTSTTHERFFGPSSSSDTFGADATALPQMLYTSLFTSLFSLLALLTTFTSGTLTPSLTLLSATPSLQIEVLAFALLSSLTLLILLSTSSTFGPTHTSYLNTLRHFISIFLNAGVNRHYRSVGIQGWCGIGWVASGVWIHASPSSEVLLPSDEEFDREGLLKDGSRAPSPDLPSYRWTSFPRPPDHSFKRYAIQYILPVALPIFLSLLVAALDPDFSASVEQPIYELASEVKVESADGEFVVIEGGDWEKELHEAVEPRCGNETLRWEGRRRTALASNPRSGNTFTRELVERATGLQTSTVSYCDHSLVGAFAGECDHEANLLAKTHYPEHDSEVDAGYIDLHGIDQAVHLIRNPIDTLYSSWQLAHVPKTANGQLDHSGRLNIEKLGATAAQRADVLERASIWAHHEQYWRDASIPVHVVRYEDLMNFRLPTVMSILTFLFPPAELPSLASLVCITELDESREAYKSRKSPEFASWDKWDEELRKEMLEVLSVGWCRHGYDELLRQKLGSETGVDGICK